MVDHPLVNCEQVEVARVRRGGALRLAAAIVAGLVAVLLAPAAPASAHAAFVRSDPPAGSVVDAVPAQVVLTFSEPVRLIPGKVRVVSPDGARADRDEATVSGSELRIPLRSGGARGTYVVSYRLISADSHPVGGAVTFAVGAPSATPPGVDISTRTDRLVAVLLAAAHYLGFAGLAVVIGAVLVLATLWPRRLPRRAAVRLVFAGLGLLIAGTVAELYLQAPYTAGTTLFGAAEADLRDVFNSRFGAAHLVRLAVIAAVGVLLRPFLVAEASSDAAGGEEAGGSARSGVADRAALAVLALVGLATWPMSGHAGASAVPVVTTVADVAHLGAMGVWLGGIVALFGLLLRQATPRELAAILPVWSRWATIAIGVLVVAGTTQALIQIGTPAALVGTTYGRLVLVKIGLFAVVLLAASLSRRLALAAPADPGVGADLRRNRLRRLLLVELAVVAVVLGVTAALVQTTPAGSARDAAAEQNSNLYSVTLTSPLYQVQLDVVPGQVGGNSVHLYAYTPQGAPLTVVEWRVTAALPEEGIEELPVTMLPLTDSHATGEARLSRPGTWQLRITLRVSDFDQATVTAKVPIT